MTVWLSRELICRAKCHYRKDMGTYTTLTNESIDIHLGDDWYDNGWSISSGRATHVSCNEGTIRNTTMPTEAGETYKVRFTVMNWSSGIVYAILGGVNGPNVSANGTYEQEITAMDSSGLKFWSDGDLTIELIRVSLGEIPAVTFSFDRNNLLWASYWSYSPDLMARFLDGYYTWKDGQLWKHNANEVRNNFYGDQYPSIIKFFVNISPTQIKDFYSVRLKSNKVWVATEIRIPPREGKSNGQLSRLKKGRFKRLQGDWFADFMRDMLDPRFINELDALTQGALLQGNWMEITLENNDEGEVRMMSVDVQVGASNYTY